MDISSFLQSVRSIRVSTEQLSNIMKRDAGNRRIDYARIQELDRRLKRVIPIIPGEFGVAGGIFGTSIVPQTPMFGMPMRPPGLPPIPPIPPGPPGPAGPGPAGPQGPRGPLPDEEVVEESKERQTIEESIRRQEEAKAAAEAERQRQRQQQKVEQEAEAEVEEPTTTPVEPTPGKPQVLPPLEEPAAPAFPPEMSKIITPKDLKTLMDKYYDPKNRGLFGRPFTQTVKLPLGTLVVEPTSTNIFRPNYLPKFRFLPNEKFEKAAKDMEGVTNAMELLQLVMTVLSAFGRTTPQITAPRPTTVPAIPKPTTVAPQNQVVPGPRQVPARARVVGPETPMVRGIVRTPQFAERQRELNRLGLSPRQIARDRAKKARDRKRLEQAREFLAQQGEESKLGQMTPQAEAARRQAIKDMISVFRDPTYFAGGVVRPGSPADLMGMNNPALRAKFIQYLETFTPRTGQEINYNAIQKRLNAMGLDVLGETGPAPGLIGRDTFRNILNFIKKPEVRKDFKIDPRDLLQRLEKSNRIDPDAANFYRKRVETESNQLRQSISGQEVSSVNIGPGGPQIALQRVYIYRNA